MPTITIVDETTSGATAPGWAMRIPGEAVRLDELIRRRVCQEVAASGSAADPEERVRAALDAFARNGFVVLVDDRQVTEPDETVELRAGSRVTFLKLVPLVGG
ncbi:hypothetical protein [Actinoplanes sp. NPDC051851]|uniref:hypothetical protein n=1 Tax=Actinoplanes sp. NPDC051851 TaxID=3154753 RepID=UPI003412AB4E